MERKEFIQLVGRGAATALILPCLTYCSSESEDPQPSGNNGNNNNNGGGVDFTLDLSDNANADLQSAGGFVYEGEIIVARTKDDDFVAVAKNCTHQGTDVVYQNDADRFHCPNHGSNFNTDGSVINGPAARALKEYNTEFDSNNNTLRVFEDSANAIA